jgi:hypothetical protein
MTSMFGKAKEHLKILIAKSDGRSIEAVAFFAPEKLVEKANGAKTLSIVANIERSFFLGRETIRLRIEGIL